MKKAFIFLMSVTALASSVANAGHHHGDVTVYNNGMGTKVKENIYTGKTHIVSHDIFGNKIRTNPYTGSVTVHDRWSGIKYRRNSYYTGRIYGHEHYRYLYGERYNIGFYDGVALGLIAGSLAYSDRPLIPAYDWDVISTNYYHNYGVTLMPSMVAMYPLEDGSCYDALFVRTPMGDMEPIGHYPVRECVVPASTSF